MGKRRPSNPRERKQSADLADPTPPPPSKKRGKYMLRGKTTWVPDDNVEESSSSSESEEESTSTEEEEEVDLQAIVGPVVRRVLRNMTDSPSMQLTLKESRYIDTLSATARDELHGVISRVASIMNSEGDIPQRIRILRMPISDEMKVVAIRKLDKLRELDESERGESTKLRSWVDGFLRIPFGITRPLAVRYEDGVRSCSDFMTKSRTHMDTGIYGMHSAKIKIMEILSKLMVNPTSIGNVITLAGPPGVGKTEFARTAIADTLHRPFLFFTLGGASDISNFVGHSYTYEGSIWGRIVDSLMTCGRSDAVLYFDEVDKISNTAHGEEIASMLIHLTDPTQNSHFHDRYFAGVDIDMSKCLFVFSCNDLTKINHILHNRMTTIECGGYTQDDKVQILKRHIWPQFLAKLHFKPADIVFESDVMRFMITEYGGEEQGVRNVIRAIDTMVSRLNMLRLSKDDSMKEYSFYMDVQFPFVLTPLRVQTLLQEKKKEENESWRHMYT